MRTLVILILLTFTTIIIPQETGIYFKKKEYKPYPIPNYKLEKQNLPRPILTKQIEWIDMYWKCWEIAFKGIKRPQENSPLVSNWLDEAFSENIFQWDTIFMLMFAKYAFNIFPAIESLDNFYALQHSDGFIGREFREKDGKLIHFDFDGGLFSSKGWKNMINPPLFSWVEYENYRLTGNLKRLEQVLPVLEKYAEWINREGDPEALDWKNNGRRAKNSKHNLFWNTPLGSGMDNTPRPTEAGSGWVEMSSQMVILYNYLSKICLELNDLEKSSVYSDSAAAIGNRINKWCWNDDDGFYYDVLKDGTQFKKKTIGGFWPLLAQVPSLKQAKKLISHLTNKNEFWRRMVVPTLSADEPEYDPEGGYWLGGVWAPTNVMIIKGLENYGFYELAYEITSKYLYGMYRVFEIRNTVYENYAPDYYLPGNPSKDDFVGWTGCGPIQLMIENILGFSFDARNETVFWRILRDDKHGIENLHFNENTLSAVYNGDSSNPEISIQCDKKITLVIILKNKEITFEISPGKSQILLTQ